jgi:hypothetical protein
MRLYAPPLAAVPEHTTILKPSCQLLKPSCQLCIARAELALGTVGAVRKSRTFPFVSTWVLPVEVRRPFALACDRELARTDGC